MKLERHHYVLMAIFIITLAARLYFAFQVDNFSPESYFNILKTNDIIEDQIPLLQSRLELGDIFNFSPIFYYVLALFKLGLGDLAFKMIPQILVSLLVIVVYLISYEITEDKDASLFAAFISGFIPVAFGQTLNNVSIYTLVIPMTFFLIYSFFKIEEKTKYVYFFIILLGVLRLTHPSVILLIIALLIYLVFIKVENLEQSRAEIEIILFSTLLIVWSLFINFKNALLIHGPFIIWQNIPREILSTYFSQITILNAVSQIGIIPFIFGIYIIYKFAFVNKDRKTYLLIAFGLTMAFLLWFKLISLNVGLMFLGTVLTILFSQFYKMLFIYIEHTKFAKFRNLVFLSILLIFIFTSVLPSAILAQSELKKSVNEEEITALEWMRANTKANSTILTTLEEGFLITTIAHRNNVIDENFLFIQDSEERLKDVNKMHTTLFKTEAIRLMNEYKVEYIYFSERARQEFGVDQLNYIDDDCFDLIYDNQVKIYELLCVLEER